VSFYAVAAVRRQLNGGCGQYVWSVVALRSNGPITFDNGLIRRAAARVMARSPTVRSAYVEILQRESHIASSPGSYLRVARNGAAGIHRRKDTAMSPEDNKAVLAAGSPSSGGGTTTRM